LAAEKDKIIQMIKKTKHIRGRRVKGVIKVQQKERHQPRPEQHKGGGPGGKRVTDAKNDMTGKNTARNEILYKKKVR